MYRNGGRGKNQIVWLTKRLILTRSRCPPVSNMGTQVLLAQQRRHSRKTCGINPVLVGIYNFPKEDKADERSRPFLCGLKETLLPASSIGIETLISIHLTQMPWESHMLFTQIGHCASKESTCQEVLRRAEARGPSLLGLCDLLHTVVY